MALNHEDIVEIERVLDERYVRQQICDERHEKVNSKCANDYKRLELLKSDLSLFIKIAFAILTAAIGQFVVSIFNLILKGVG